MKKNTALYTRKHPQDCDVLKHNVEGMLNACTVFSCNMFIDRRIF